MREVFPRNEFKRDLRRVARGPYRQILLKYGELVLVYTLEGDDLLILERLGSHTELFGI